MTPEVALSAMDWLIMVSAAVIALVSILGIVNDQYKDTFLQCVGLCLMCGVSLIVILQYLTRGEPTLNAFGGMHLGIAIYGVATVIKHLGHQRRARKQKRRLHDA